MSSDFDARARQRQATWQGSSVSSVNQMQKQEQLFWSGITPSVKFDTVWEMALEAWRLKRGAEPAPRLFGSPVGIRKRKG